MKKLVAIFGFIPSVFADTVDMGLSTLQTDLTSQIEATIPTIMAIFGIMIAIYLTLKLVRRVTGR